MPHRFYISLIAGLALGACASNSFHGGSLTPTSDLAICATTVSNAPSLDRNGTVSAYDPYARIGSVILARAPVHGCLSSGFGPRRGGAGSFHKGIDLYTNGPMEIGAGGDGIVEFIGDKRGYGRTIIIRHNDRLTTRYGHLSKYARGLKPGMRVRRGDIIAMTGKSGNATAVHLHYEILIGDNAQNPLTVGR